MSRAVAPINQWPEPYPGKTASRMVRLYPTLEGDLWGWTDVAADADGIVVVESGVLGVDDSTVVGGLRVLGLPGTGPMLVLGD